MEISAIEQNLDEEIKRVEKELSEERRPSILKDDMRTQRINKDGASSGNTQT